MHILGVQRSATRHLRRTLDEEGIETNREPNHTASLFCHNVGLPVLAAARGQYGNGVAVIPNVITVMVIAGCLLTALLQSINQRQRSMNLLLIGGRATAFEASSEKHCESNNRTSRIRECYLLTSIGSWKQLNMLQGMGCGLKTSLV
jgi:hypothetical protein